MTFQVTEPAILLADEPTSRLSIDNAGNVGIGTPAPAAKLEVSGTGDTTADLLCQRSTALRHDEGGLWVARDRFVGGHSTDKIVREQLEQRVSELQAERRAGQEMLAELDGRQAELQQTLLRIGGAIQVLGELLEAEPTRAAEAVDPGHPAA